MLDRYAIVTAAKAASAKKGIKLQRAGIERGETTLKRGRGGSCPGSSRAEAQKRNPTQSRDSGEGTWKRSKPSGPDRTAVGEGAASGVTTAQTGTSRSVPPAEVSRNSPSFRESSGRTTRRASYSRRKLQEYTSTNAS